MNAGIANSALAKHVTSPITAVRPNENTAW
jgi:hypothetical protein